MKNFTIKYKSNYTKFTFIGISTLMLLCFFIIKPWNKKQVIDWDISYYYSYLPATFIYGEYNFNEKDSLWTAAHFRFTQLEDGGQTPKMTAGLAVLYSPFFLAAHAYASLSECCPANGFSTPYQFSILFSALVYALIGLWFFGKWMRLFFSSAVVAGCMALLYLGTNIFYYSLFDPMSHVYNFMLLGGLLFCFQSYLKKQSIRYALLIGLASGLLVLIRPTNIIMLLFPAILLIHHRHQLKWPPLLRDVLIAAFIAFLTCLPQLLYWHHMTGQWLVYSYGEQRFYFNDPKIWQGLFSYRKGWFTYSPVLLLALPGFWLLYQQKKQIYALAALLTLTVALYVHFSWWCWWYGGGFGARTLIEFLPFMGIAMAAFLHWVWQQSNIIKALLLSLSLLLGGVGLYLNEQYSRGYIHYDSMSGANYWQLFQHGNNPEFYKEHLKHPDYEKALHSGER